MADKQQEKQGHTSDEPTRGDERDANDTPPPRPTREEARREIEQEDRFEATDN